MELSAQKGDVVLIAAPGRLGIRRPAVIVAVGEGEVKVVSLCSPGNFKTTDSSILVSMNSSEGAKAGLRRDSVIDCSLSALVPMDFLVTKIGCFTSAVVARVEKILESNESGNS